jgi:glycosyltransferase involved in cell wall biosynthesis
VTQGPDSRRGGAARHTRSLETGRHPPDTGPRRASVVHLIPYDGIGGVEVAARSLPAGDHDGHDDPRGGDLRFAKLFLSSRCGVTGGVTGGAHVWTGPRASEWAPGNYLGAVAELRRRRPDLVIVSLWRSCIVALLAKAVMPRLRLVAFLHLAAPVHLPDRLLNAAVMRLAKEIWADSDSTLAARLPGSQRHKGRVISFLTERLERVTQGPAAARFIFWGRLHPQKGLDRALEVFARIAATRPQARFTVIGPDMGHRRALEAQAHDLGVAGQITFTGPMAREAIFALAGEHDFYLQPSRAEGMAMSVVEAMQLGLVPVVAPVGEIPRYCRDGETALFMAPYEDAAAVATRLDALLAAPDRVERMARAAHDVWAARPLYRDDVLAASRAVLGRDRSGRQD